MKGSMRNFLTLFLLLSIQGKAQLSAYEDSIIRFRKDYIANHEAVKSAYDREHLFRFFPPNPKYRVEANFTRIEDSTGFDMTTYSNKKKGFLVYGYADFILQGKKCRLYLYRSRKLMTDPKYKDDLFLPFIDKTSGKESYSCRYIDLKIGDIREGRVAIDFNTCYNPYCAYGDGWNCPIPPSENHLRVSIRAGEKKFMRPHE